MESILPRDTRLCIKISHSSPVEINEFASTMNAFGSLFESFCKYNADSTDGRKAKLYIEKIEHGSIEINLVETVSALALPLIESMNLIMDFAGHLKRVYDYYANGRGTKPELSEAECRDFRRSLNVVSGDNKGEMEVYATSGHAGAVYNNCVVLQLAGNAAQNRLDREAERLREEAPHTDRFDKVLMTVYQMRGDLNQTAGNKARIDEISTRSLPVRFDSDSIKSRILGIADNPTRKAFLVDVEVKTAEGRPAVYNVVALHDVYDLN